MTCHLTARRTRARINAVLYGTHRARAGGRER